MFVFANRMLRDKWKSFVIYSISAIAFLEMYVALFPTISKQAGQFDQLLKTMPPELFKAMNMDPATLSFGDFQSYMSSEYMSFLWPILAIVFAVSLASYISVNEIDKGTIETLASLPAKRSKVFLERYFAGLSLLAFFCAISLFGVIPLAKLHGVEIVMGNYFTATIGSFLFIWAVYSLATLFSVIFSEKGRASMASGGILILMYVLYVVSTLNDSVKSLKYFSFFNYFSGSELLAKNIYPQYALLALGGFAILSAIMALLWFNRRDLSV